MADPQTTAHQLGTTGLILYRRGNNNKIVERDIIIVLTQHEKLIVFIVFCFVIITCTDGPAPIVVTVAVTDADIREVIRAIPPLQIKNKIKLNSYVCCFNSYVHYIGNISTLFYRLTGNTLVNIHSDIKLKLVN